jgi:septum site-determining protein MinC
MIHNSMMDNLLRTRAFKLKGRLFTLTVLSLQETDILLCSQQLQEVVGQAPKMFNNTPIILDLSAVELDNVDFPGLSHLARNFGVVFIGVLGADDKTEAFAKAHGLAVVNSSEVKDKKMIPPVESPAVSPINCKSKLISTPVRSGQQVVSQSDLIIAASVSPGAELLADGSIHVYGVLRGRALAGINGDKNARIFCQALDAELVSIAGYYKLSDTMEKVDVACQIYIEEDHLQIEPI